MASNAIVRREPNFLDKEKALLLELVRQSPLLENKKTDKVCVAAKERAWELLSVEFNAAGISCERSVKCLKKRWQNMKDRCKADAAKLKKEQRKTGGGIIEVDVDPLSEGVACMLEFTYAMWGGST